MSTVARVLAMVEYQVELDRDMNYTGVIAIAADHMAAEVEKAEFQ
jgi:hypothetical protein